MARKTGIFKSVGALAQTTLNSTESVIGSTLNTVDESMQAIAGVARQFNNDCKGDLIESVVDLAQTTNTAVTRLRELNYSDVQISAMLPDSHLHTQPTISA